MKKRNLFSIMILTLVLTFSYSSQIFAEGGGNRPNKKRWKCMSSKKVGSNCIWPGKDCSSALCKNPNKC